MRAMPDRPDEHSDLSHVSPRPAMGSSPVGRRVWALTDFFVFVSASCLPRRPSRRLLAPLPQDREERVVRIPRRVVPLRVCHHRRRIPRALRLPAPHRHNSGYEQPAPLPKVSPNAGDSKLTTFLFRETPQAPGSRSSDSGMSSRGGAAARSLRPSRPSVCCAPSPAAAGATLRRATTTTGTTSS